MKIKHHIISLETQPGISLFNISPDIEKFIQSSNISNGFVVVSSRHTTTAIAINEHEERLLDDIRQFFHRLVPPGEPYLHNDIHLRDCPQDEPLNAHSHLIAMLLGSSESIPVVEGNMALGQYQSVMLVELDGSRTRQINIQIIGE